jgi:isopenicillin N synthase-like dioxygenase
MAAAIPLIDLDTWFDGTPDQRRTLAAEVDAHLRRLGFLVVVNHRLVLPPPAERQQEELISLAFFGEPDHDALIQSLPTCVSATEPAKHAPVLAHEYLAAKMDALAVVP